MHCKTLLSTIILLLLCLLLSGCVYLRLLELKNQFNEFDDYIIIKKDAGFSLYFKQPILEKTDILNLSKLSPTQILSDDDGEIWTYHFDKIHNPDQHIHQPVSLVFRFRFNQQDKLQQWFFPDEFLAIVPDEFLEASLRSLGQATIFKLSRKIKADVTRLNTSASPPDQASVQKVLGPAYEIVNENTFQRFLYRFKLKTDRIEEGYEDRQIALVKLDFVPLKQILFKASPRFAGLKISVNYSKLLGQDYFNESK
ncbi:MAG: hypothetical protein K0U68_13450 [Gammaproteobacteria bacterium]|nr:hypothetical protein [Gammaproteobacteria bacterium]